MKDKTKKKGRNRKKEWKHGYIKKATEKQKKKNIIEAEKEKETL